MSLKGRHDDMVEERSPCLGNEVGPGAGPHSQVPHASSLVPLDVPASTELTTTERQQSTYFQEDLE